MARSPRSINSRRSSGPSAPRWRPTRARRSSTSGVGEPDEMAFPEVVEKLCAEARKPENRGYADNGDAVLKQPRRATCERVCGVPGIDPETEVLHSIGSKAALSILPAALINPGDVVLMTMPGYPVFGTHAKYYGGLVHNLPLTGREPIPARPRLRFRPKCCAKAKVLVLNYPNNPTGASATPEFFAEVGGVREGEPAGRHPRCRLCRAGIRGHAAELPGHARREGSRAWSCTPPARAST